MEVDLEKQSDELLELSEFINNFNMHFSLLLRRYKRFKEINTIDNTDIDVITYLDIIVVQLRAMCVESANNKKNYTAQIFLRKVGEILLADKIDKMLEEPFIEDTDFTIKTAIKLLADKFVCHYDNFDGANRDDLAMANIIESRLRSPYNKPNLDYIMKTIIDVVGEGFVIR